MPSALIGLASSGSAAALMLPGLVIGPSLDAGVFALVGARLRSGAFPYVGTWDHKPPGIYLADAAAGAIFPGHPWLAAWLVTVVALGATGVVLAASLHRLGYTWEAPVVAIAAVGGMAQFIVSLGGGLTEQLAVVPAAAAFALAIRQPHARGWLVVGILAAAAVGTSLPAISLIAALAVLAVDGPRTTRNLLNMLLGGMMVVVAAALLLGVAGALPATADALIHYNLVFRAATFINAGGGTAGVSGATLSLVYLVVPAALGALAARRSRDGLVRRVALAAVGWASAAVVLYFVQGRFESHYAALLPVPLAYLAAGGLRHTQQLVGRLRRRRWLPIAPLGIGVLVSAGVIATSSPIMIAAIGADAARSHTIGLYLQGHVATSESIFVWGNAPQVYLEAQRPAASRYVYAYPLTTPGYSSPEQVAGLIAELSARPPAMIVDAGSPAPGVPGLPPLLVPRPVATDGRDYDALDPLRAWVRANYRLIATVSGWPVYSRRGG